MCLYFVVNSKILTPWFGIYLGCGEMSFIDIWGGKVSGGLPLGIIVIISVFIYGAIKQGSH